MKKLLLTIGLVTAGSLAYGQGTVAFSNNAFNRVSTQTVGVPASLTSASTVLGTFSYGLFYGIGESTSLSLLTSQFGVNSTSTAGVISSPADSKTALNLVGITGTAGAQANVYLQFAGWSASYGSDWAAAKAGANIGNGYFGTTPIILAPPLGDPAGPGAVIWGLSTATSPNVFHGGFTLFTNVPEPSTMALSGLGVAAMLIFRRRK